MDTLTDGEIRKACTAAGIKAGPITVTTRKLYLKRLANLNTNPSKQKKEVVKPLTKKETNIQNNASEHNKSILQEDYETLSNEDLGSYMRKLGLRYGMINRHNRPNYYRRIRQRIAQEFSTDDDEMPSEANEVKSVEQKSFKIPVKKPAVRTIQVDDFSSSESEDDVPCTKDAQCSTLHNDTSIESPQRTPKHARSLPERNDKENRVPPPVRNEISENIKQYSPYSNADPQLPHIATSTPAKPAKHDDYIPITRERSPKMEHFREKRKMNSTDIVTQERRPATSAAYSNNAEPDSKRLKSIITSPNDQSDLVDLRFANFLPKLGLFAIFAVVSCYILKSWDQLEFSLIPEVETSTGEDVGEVATPTGKPIADMQQLMYVYYQVNDAILDSKCRFQNIYSLIETPMVHFSNLNLNEVPPDVMLEHINQKSDLFLFYDSNMTATNVIAEDGYVSLEMEHVDMNLYCQFIMLLSKNFESIAIGLIIIFISFIAKLLVLKYQNKKKQFFQLTNRMAKETIDVLQNHAARQGSETGIKKTTVRDQVVMMGDDPRYWIDVEKMLKKDSRLITNQMVCDGEDHEIWKWQETRINGELCQGKAFESVGPKGDKIPASCLKVRNMFDPNDSIELPRLINIIAEWCKKINGILHIDISKPEGFLFIKCKDRPSAGKAFAAINANWYNRKMVAVSYIRLARYERRFPDSIGISEIII